MTRGFLSLALLLAYPAAAFATGSVGATARHTPATAAALFRFKSREDLEWAFTVGGIVGLSALALVFLVSMLRDSKKAVDESRRPKKPWEF